MNRFLLFIRTKNRISWADLVVIVLIVGLLYAVLDLGKGMIVPFSPSQQPVIHLDPRYLPYYAGRSLLRMLLAFLLSLVFTFVYGRIAAYNKTAERIMIPALDILQSVPVLGYLSITVTAFLALFPGSLFGAECASIFAIFTSQVWNMTFSFYQSLTTIPKDLQEAAQMNRLRPWARFTTLEVPFSMIGLVWSSMMSFGGSWFFLAASESITVLHNNIQLPGIGSYLFDAFAAWNVPDMIYGILTMVIVVVAVDQFLWRPVVAWAQKFKLDQNEVGDPPTSWFLQLLRRSEWVQALAQTAFSMGGRSIARITPPRSTAPAEIKPQSRLRSGLRHAVNWALLVVLILFFGRYMIAAVREVAGLGMRSILYTIELGFFTLLRVMASTALAALWTIPVGVMIGLSSRLSRIAQPVIQVVTSFPWVMIFPLIVILYLRLHFSFDIGSVPLMMLGTQWYILFSVVAGTMAIPSGLREASSILRLRSFTWWKTLILPAIFPYLVTGGITASGGAWNASIVAEFVSLSNKHHVTATGLGAYITLATQNGQWAEIIWGIAVMSAFVVVFNRLVWRPLYRLAETKYHLD